MRLELADISHQYGQVTAVEKINFSVEDGEIVAIVGPSGCGKSTLLSIAGGLLQPSKGAVYCQGEPPEGCLNPLTYVFQDFALLPWRTVEGNIKIVLQDHKLPKQERNKRIASVLHRTGLTDFAKAFPRQLSGGMCQRVGIARALAVRPAVLLMDEPLSALDAQTRSILIEEFAALFAQLHISAIYVTHNLDEAVRLADRVVALSRRPGRVREIVTVSIPIEERLVRSTELKPYQSRLWNLIKKEAIAADQELASGS